jgi:hypothetical protein
MLSGRTDATSRGAWPGFGFANVDSSIVRQPFHVCGHLLSMAVMGTHKRPVLFGTEIARFWNQRKSGDQPAMVHLGRQRVNGHVTLTA